MLIVLSHPFGAELEGESHRKKKNLVELPQCGIESHRTGCRAMCSTGVKIATMALKLVIQGNKMLSLWF